MFQGRSLLAPFVTLGLVCTFHGQANAWTPGPALVGRLNVLGALPAAEQTVSQNAYFQTVSPGPSMSVALVLNDGPFYTQAYGFPNGVPATEDTAFYIASSTKVFTAMAMLKLIELNPGMSLDDPVSKYYSPVSTVKYPPGSPPAACPKPCNPAPQMTLRHLITHASGLPNYGMYAQGVDANFPTDAQFDAMIASTQLEFYPGYNRDYSGVGISVAGRVIEVVSHLTYTQFMQQYMLAPLQMFRSSISPLDPTMLPPDTVIAPAYDEISNPAGSGTGDTFSPVTLSSSFPTVTALSPPGHLVTTARDVSQFLFMQLWPTAPTSYAFPSFPLTPQDVSLSHSELLPAIPPVNVGDPCQMCLPANAQPCTWTACSQLATTSTWAELWPYENCSGSLAGQECGAGWWYSGQACPGDSHFDSTLGNWNNVSGSFGIYQSVLEIAPSVPVNPGAPNVGVAAAAMGSSMPDEPASGSNPHDPYLWNSASALVYAAAPALAAAANGAPTWSSQPLPAALESLMALLNGGAITTSSMNQVFSPALVTPSLLSSLQALQTAAAGQPCSSFTVQGVSSTTSASVTLICGNETIPLAFTAASSAPYSITAFTLLAVPPPAAGVAADQTGDYDNTLWYVANNGQLSESQSICAAGWCSAEAWAPTSGSPRQYPPGAPVAALSYEFSVGTGADKKPIYELMSHAFAIDDTQTMYDAMTESIPQFPGAGGSALETVSTSATPLNPGGAVAVVSRQLHFLDAFAVGTDGALYDFWSENDGSTWGAVRITNTNLFAPLAGVAAVAMNASTLNVFAVGQNQYTYVVTWSPSTNFTWTTTTVSGFDSYSGAQLAAVSRAAGYLDVFLVGFNGQLFDLYSENSGQGWGWAAIGNPQTFSTNTAIAAMVGPNSSLRAYAIGLNGSIYSAAWGNGQWTWSLTPIPGPGWFPAAPSKPALAYFPSGGGSNPEPGLLAVTVQNSLQSAQQSSQWTFAAVPTP